MSVKGIHFNVPEENKCACGQPSVQWYANAHRCARCKRIEEERRGEENAVAQRLIGEQRRLARAVPEVVPCLEKPEQRVERYVNQILSWRNKNHTSCDRRTQPSSPSYARSAS